VYRTGSYVKSAAEFIRPTDSRVLMGDARRAKRILGWVPEVTFDAMVEDMLRMDLDTLSSGPPGTAESV
jgi:GDPmannose 4,6-dehydratase